MLVGGFWESKPTHHKSPCITCEKHCVDVTYYPWNLNSQLPAKSPFSKNALCTFLLEYNGNLFRNNNSDLAWIKPFSFFSSPAFRIRARRAENGRGKIVFLIRIWLSAFQWSRCWLFLRGCLLLSWFYSPGGGKKGLIEQVKNMRNERERIPQIGLFAARDLSLPKRSLKRLFKILNIHFFEIPADSLQQKVACTVFAILDTG